MRKTCRIKNLLFGAGIKWKDAGKCRFVFHKHDFGTGMSYYFAFHSNLFSVGVGYIKNKTIKHLSK
jgi:hypothetical protein